MVGLLGKIFSGSRSRNSLLENIFQNLSISGKYFPIDLLLVALLENIFSLALGCCMSYSGKYFPKMPLWWKIFVNFGKIQAVNGKYFTKPPARDHIFLQWRQGEQADFKAWTRWDTQKACRTYLYTQHERFTSHDHREKLVSYTWEIVPRRNVEPSHSLGI